MKAKPRFTLKLLVGDAGGDGHAHVEVVLVKCSLDREGLADAYKRGCEIVGFKLEEAVAVEYNNNTLPVGIEQKLTNVDFDWNCIGDTENRNDIDEIYIYTQDYVELFMFICGLGSPTLTWNVARDIKRLDIGGYGLYLD